MLPEIDARVLFVASAVVFGGLAISVALAWQELRAIRGPDRFAQSYVLFLVGLLLLALRGRVPDVLSMTAANVLIVVGAALVLEGTKLFFGLSPGRPVTVWTGLVATAAFAFYSHVRVSEDARTILSSTFLAALLGAAGWTAWHRRPRSGVQVLEKVTAIALTLCALLFWARAVAFGAGLAGDAILDGSVWVAVPPLLCTLCAVVWTTTLLSNTSRRLTNVVQAQNDLLASLLSVARAAGDGSNLDATLGRVLEAAVDLTKATGASLLMLDEEGRFHRGVFAHGATTTEVGESEAEMILEKGLAAWVLRNRTAGIVSDTDADPRWHKLPSRQAPIRSALSAPISSGSIPSGVLTLDHPEPGHFGEEQRLLLESTTAQIALALRNAQNADARLRAAREQELLNRVLEISARRNDEGEIVTLSAEAIAHGSPWTRVYLAIPGEDGHFQLHGRTEGLPDLHPRTGEGILGRAYESGTAQRDAAPRSPGGVPPAGTGAWSRLAIPLRHLSRTLGVAAFESTPPRTIDDGGAALAEALAEAVSLGLGKAAFARSRDELTRAMVHDLRGPVSGVKGALELLGEAPGLRTSERELIEMAERNTRRQVELIEGILELARLEDGALPVHPADTRLADLVADVLRMARPPAEARKLELVADVPDELPSVRVDPGLIGRVLENLVGNAVKFSAPNAGPVLVSARANGEMVEVRVRDSGPGVEEALRPRLFQKFAAGSHAHRGTGLGLAFCRLAVEANGGRIWLDSPGPGAVFAFRLPVSGPAGGDRVARPC